MKTEAILDIIFGAVVLPGMMFLFPTGEWLVWQPGPVLTFIVWLYAVWALNRFVLGRLLRDGRTGLLTAAGALFLLAVVNFLLTYSPVTFPDEPVVRIGEMHLHVRAMWVLFLVVVAYSFPAGYLNARIRDLSAVKQEQQALSDAATALETRRAPVFGAEEIRVKAGYKVVHVPLSAIQYIEGRNNYACFHLDHRPDVVSQIPLKNILEQLPAGKFVRIHRSYIVPLWRIEKRTAAAVQLMGVEGELPLGRSYRENLLNG